MAGGWPRVARAYPNPSGVLRVEVFSRTRIGSIMLTGFTITLSLLSVTFWLPSANGEGSLGVLGKLFPAGRG